MPIKLEYPARADGAKVAFVTLDNEAKLNTLNRALMTELIAVMADLAQDTALRAVVLTGAGTRAFVGGADNTEMAGLDRDSAAQFITLVHRCWGAIRRLPVPGVRRVLGFAWGAGMELAAACDFRVAAGTAKFGMPEVKLGIPSVVEAALLPHL